MGRPQPSGLAVGPSTPPAPGYQASCSKAGDSDRAETAIQPIHEKRKPMKKGGMPAATEPSCGPQMEVGP